MHWLRAQDFGTTPKHLHIVSILKSLHWLKILKRIHFKVISRTYNCLQYSQPKYPRELLPSSQPALPDHYPFSLVLDLVATHLKFSNRTTSITAPRLWNNLPPEFRTFSVPPLSLPIAHYH